VHYLRKELEAREVSFEDGDTINILKRALKANIFGEGKKLQSFELVSDSVLDAVHNGMLNNNN
jgi:hypothetical protein